MSTKTSGEKRKAQEDVVSNQVAEDELSKVEVTVVKDLNLLEVPLRNDITERELEGCIVIEAMKESYAEVNGKWKANMFYNM